MRVSFITLCLLFVLFNYTAFADSADQKAALMEATAATEALEAQPAQAPQFPARRPANAIRGVFERYGDRFEIYFWRQDSHAWIEIIPLGSEPFICGPSFTIIQNRIPYATVKLGSLTSTSHCGDIRSPAILWFTQYSFYEDKADLAKAFTIGYSGGRNSYRLAIPAGPPGTVIDPDDDDDTLPEPGGGGCLIQILKK